MTSPPPGICGNCFATWKARRPQPAAVYCHHQGVVARPTDSAGWEIEPAKGRAALERLRQEGVR